MRRMKAIPRERRRTASSVRASLCLPSELRKLWKPTGMTMAVTAMPRRTTRSQKPCENSEGERRTEHVDIELGIADRMALLVELDTAGEVGAAENEETVGEQAAEHRRADNVQLALDEGEDR